MKIFSICKCCRPKERGQLTKNLNFRKLSKRVNICAVLNKGNQFLLYKKYIFKE